MLQLEGEKSRLQERLRIKFIPKCNIGIAGKLFAKLLRDRAATSPAGTPSVSPTPLEYLSPVRRDDAPDLAAMLAAKPSEMIPVVERYTGVGRGRPRRSRVQLQLTIEAGAGACMTGNSIAHDLGFHLQHVRRLRAPSLWTKVLLVCEAVAG